MKKRILISAIAILLVTTAMTSAATACERGKHGSYDRQHTKSAHHSIPGESLAYLRLVVKSAKILELSKKQQEEVGKLLVKAEAGAATAHARAEITVAAFRAKLYSGKVTDNKDVQAYSKRMGELRAESLASCLLPSIQVKSILSVAQQEKLKALHRQDRSRSCSPKARQGNAGSRA